LRAMKMLKVAQPVRLQKERVSPARPSKKSKPAHKKKRTRSLSQRFLEEIWDFVEDVFDDVLDDLFD